MTDIIKPKNTIIYLFLIIIIIFKWNLIDESVFVLTSNNKIYLHSIKDQIPKLDKKGLVYKIKFQTFNKFTYITFQCTQRAMNMSLILIMCKYYYYE